MAIQTPTIKELQARIISDIESEVGQTIPLLSKAVFRVLGFALAGLWIILYKYGTDAFKQRFVQTASETYLVYLGELVGIFRQQPTTWIGTASVVSTTTGTLEAGETLVNNNTGIVYRVRQSVSLIVGTVVFPIASNSSGTLGNLNNGDTLDFVTSPVGYEGTATILSTIIEAEDIETLELYRQRVLNRYQKKPQGGADADYEEWGLEAPNVISVYPYAAITPGEVDIYIEVDNQTDGIPTSGQLITTEQYMLYDPITGRRTRRPVTAELNLLPIARIIFNFEVVGLSPLTPAIQTLIETSLTDMCSDKDPYIQGLSTTRNDTISQAEATSLVQAIAKVNGATISGVKVTYLGSYIDLQILNAGQKCKVGTVTFV